MIRLFLIFLFKPTLLNGRRLRAAILKRMPKAVRKEKAL